MSGSQDAERPSRSPRRASFASNASTVYLSHHVTSSRTSRAPRVPYFSMPNPERNLYSNKESAKVNAGLPVDASKVEHEEQEDSSSKAFSTNTSAVDMDFNNLLVPIVAPEPGPSVETLAHRLLQPPKHAFVHGILSIQWVRGVLGPKHIAFREKDERYVLAAESGLRLSGSELGLPALYLEWLCGDEDDLSAAEQGVCLTAEYFEEMAEG